MSDIEAEPVQNLSQKLSGLNTDANNNPSQKLDEEQPPSKKSKIDVEENTPPDFEEEESTFKEESETLEPEESTKIDEECSRASGVELPMSQVSQGTTPESQRMQLPMSQANPYAQVLKRESSERSTFESQRMEMKSVSKSQHNPDKVQENQVQETVADIQIQITTIPPQETDKEISKKPDTDEIIEKNIIHDEQETNKMWQIRKTIMQVCHDRNYMVSQDDLDQTLDEFKLAFGNQPSENRPKRSDLNVLVMKYNDPADQMLVFFSDEVNQKVGMKIIQHYVLRMRAEEIYRAIIVVATDLTPSAKHCIIELQDKYKVEFFTDQELLTIQFKEVSKKPDKNEVIEKNKSADEKETYKLWKIRKTIMQMCHDRNYLVSHDDVNQTLDEFKLKFGNRPSENRPKRSDLTVIMRKQWDGIPVPQVLVLYADEVDHKVDMKNMKQYFELMRASYIEHAIVVVASDKQWHMTRSAKTTMLELFDPKNDQKIGELQSEFKIESFMEQDLLSIPLKEDPENSQEIGYYPICKNTEPDKLVKETKQVLVPISIPNTPTPPRTAVRTVSSSQSSSSIRVLETPTLKSVQKPETSMVLSRDSYVEQSTQKSKNLPDSYRYKTPSGEPISNNSIEAKQVVANSTQDFLKANCSMKALRKEKRESVKRKRIDDEHEKDMVWYGECDEYPMKLDLSSKTSNDEPSNES